MKLISTIDNFINYCKVEKKYSRHTLLAYSVALKQFMSYLEEDILVFEKSEISDIAIQDITLYHIKPFLG